MLKIGFWHEHTSCAKCVGSSTVRRCRFGDAFRDAVSAMVVGNVLFEKPPFEIQ